MTAHDKGAQPIRVSGGTFYVGDEAINVKEPLFYLASEYAALLASRAELVAALEAQEAASALDDEYQELQERAAEEGWASDPTGSVQLQDAGSRASNALNLAVQLRRAALALARGAGK